MIRLKQKGASPLFVQTSLRATPHLMRGSEAISRWDCFVATLLAMTSTSIWVILFLGISLCQAEPQEAQALYLAKRAFHDGFYEIALKHFQKYLQDEPGSGDKGQIQIFISRCYLNLDKFGEALRTLENKTSAEAVYWTAQTYSAAGDYESALANFEKVIKHYPESEFFARSFYYRASCYYKGGQYNQALKFYKDFNKKFARDDLKEESSFRIGQCLYNVKDYSEAHKKFKSFVKNFPKSAHKNAGLYYLGEIEYMRGNFHEAVQYYSEAAQVQPKVKLAAFAKYARGWAHLKLKAYKKALDEFKDLRQTAGPGAALEDSIIFAQARSEAALQNYPEAIRNYERIISDFPHSNWYDDAYFWKGQALFELARFSEACGIYEQALEKFSQAKLPALADEQAKAIYGREDLSVNLADNLRYNLGWTYARMKRYVQAIEQFKQVFEESPERFLKSGALCRIGDIYLEQGKHSEAIENYDLVLKDFSDSYYADYAQYQLGVALSGKERLDSAILAFNTLIANFPRSKLLPQAHYQIGAIYFRRGEFARAQEEMQSLLKKFPQSQLKEQAANLLAYAYYNAQDYTRALDEFSALLRISKDAKLKRKAQYQIGFCLYQLGKEEKAIKEFKKFLALYPETELSSDVLFWLGKYYYRQKNFKEAQVYFADVAQNFPRNELADEAAFWQAKALFGQQRIKEAMDELQNMEADYPNSDKIADAVLLKGDILKGQGRIDEAGDLYNTVCAKFKGTDFARIAHKKRAQILQEQNLFSEAIAEYGKALRSRSDDFNARIQFAIAQCRESQEDLPQALDEYLKVYYLYPEAFVWSRKAQLKCAQIFERQAQWQKAMAIYEKLADGDSPEAECARKRLQQLKEQ